MKIRIEKIWKYENIIISHSSLICIDACVDEYEWISGLGSPKWGGSSDPLLSYLIVKYVFLVGTVSNSGKHRL